MDTIDPRIQGGRTATTIYAAVHLVLWFWLSSRSGGRDETGLTSLFGFMCLITVPFALLYWIRTPRESVMVVNIGLAILYGIAMLVLGGLAMTSASGAGIALFFPWAGYLLLTLYVIGKNVSAMRAV